MTDAIRSEWIKLRTVRANLWLIAFAMGGPLVVALLSATFAEFDTGFTNDSDTFNAIVTGPTYICLFLTGVLGVLGIGQEYRHNTIRVTFAAQPVRSVVLGAKAVVNGAFGLYVGAATQVLCLGLGGLILKARDIEIDLFEPGVNFTAMIGQTIACGLMTMMGFGVGCIMRQPAGAIPTLLLWPLVGEGIVGGLLSLAWDDAVQKWLPFRSGLRLGVIETFEDPNYFGRLGSGLYFAAWTVLIVAIGWFLVERRDA
jgi:ABC-2 type transport system permease protein